MNKNESLRRRIAELARKATTMEVFGLKASAKALVQRMRRLQDQLDRGTWHDRK